MKIIGSLLMGTGLLLFFFTFLFFTLEDYTPYSDPVPLWPMFLGAIMVIAGIFCQKKRAS